LATLGHFPPFPTRRSSDLEHWDGSQWLVVPSPNPAGGSSPALGKVSALAPDYIWAVGFYVENATVATRTLVEFWNGLEWTIVPRSEEHTSELQSPYDLVCR